MKKFIYTILLFGTIFPFQYKLCAQALKSPATESGSSEYTFYTIEFADENTGIIVGMDWMEKHSLILRTEDAGNTWKSVSHPEIKNGDWSMLTDASFSDPMNGWVSGQIGWLLHTADGGETWEKKSINATVLLSSVFCLDTNNIWIGELLDSEAGATVFRTTNGFESWESHATGIKSLIWDLYFMNADTGIAVLGWCSACPWSGHSPDSGGYILLTTNGGVDWTVQKHDTTIYGYDRIYFLNDTNGYVAGTDGSLLRTDDGGVSWSEMTSGTDVDICGLYFANADTGIITTGDLNTWTGTIYRTTDGGASWTQPDISYTNHNPIFALAHSEECTLFAPQDACNILKTIDCGATWEPASPGCVDAIDAKPAPAMKIYPNPVASLLNIETVKTDRYSIELSSLTGQTLFTDIFTGYSHRIDFSSFQNGIYFITIRSGDFVRTEKIIKI